MTRRLLLTALALAALALAGCGQAPAAQRPAPAEGQGDSATNAGKLAVLASTSIIADVVGQVGGDLVSVSTLVPLGSDTHSFEPSPQDMARVAEAQLVFVNGAGYEEFLERLLEGAGGSARLVELSEGITLRELSEGEEEGHSGEAHAEEEEGHSGEAHAEEEEGHSGEAHAEEEEHGHSEGLDPHTWTDPNNVKYWTTAIAEALADADAANAETYRSNAERYDAQLTELDAWIAEQFAPLPVEQRLLVTDHAVFGYMADRYGLRQVGAILPGFSSAAEPSAQELAALQDTIRELGVPAIFVGDVAGQGLAQRLADDTGTRIEQVLTESLTAPGGPGATYLDYMRYNVRTISEALR